MDIEAIAQAFNVSPEMVEQVRRALVGSAVDMEAAVEKMYPHKHDASLQMTTARRIAFRHGWRAALELKDKNEQN